MEEFMKKVLSLILVGSLATSAGVQANGWKWNYFWDSSFNQVVAGYGAFALLAGLGYHGLSMHDRANITNAITDKKILEKITECTYYNKSVANLIEQARQLHITQPEKDNLVAAMQTYEQNMQNEAANLRALIDVHVAKANVILRFEKTGNKFIKHSKYAAIALLIYNALIRDGQLKSFFDGFRAGLNAGH